MYLVYACSHCRVFMGKKREVMRHERECVYNPRTASCVTCRHYIPKQLPYFPTDSCDTDNRNFPKHNDGWNIVYPTHCGGYTGKL